jgi:hypothetical protein
MSAAASDPADVLGLGTDEGDAPTLRAPSSGPGDLLVVSDDAEFVQRVRHALRESTWQIEITSHLTSFDGFLMVHVIVIDPQRDRAETTVALHGLARVALRPAVVLVLRSTEDLATAVLFGLGSVEASAVDDVLANAVERAYRDRRQPRLHRAELP